MKNKHFFVLFFIFSIFFTFFSDNLLAEETDKLENKKNQYIIINKAVNKLAFYEDGVLINVFSVATGASPSATPEGNFKISVKWECPAYYKKNIGGCEVGNPLGKRWMGLSVPGTVGYTYGIHGNAAEWSIGTYASQGCVRMYNWQVEQLFNIVETGADVTIIRANKSFEEIAKDNNYIIKQPSTINEKIYLYESSSKYYGLNEELKNDSDFSTGEYTLVEEINGWKKLEDGKENTHWTNSKHIVTSDFSLPKDSFAYLNKDTNTFDDLDLEKNNFISSDKVLEVIIKTPELSLLKSHNKNIWVKNSDLKDSSKKHFDLQENNSIDLYNSLTKLKKEA